jgi:hypothetical protein
MLAPDPVRVEPKIERQLAHDRDLERASVCFTSSAQD